MVANSQSNSRKTEIVKTAKSLLASKGEAGFSLRAVAAVVDIKLASLQYYFPTRSALIEAMLADTIDLYVRELQRATAQVAHDPVETLRASLRALTGVGAVVDEEEWRLEIHLWALALNDPSANAAMIKYNKTYIGALTELILHAVPDLEKEQAHKRAFAVASLQEGAMLFLKTDASPFPQPELLEEFYQASLRVAFG